MTDLARIPLPESGAGLTGATPADQRRAALRAFLRRPSVVVSLVWLGLVAFTSLFANHLGLQNPRLQHLTETFAGPSAHHWLGTDDLGRDVLSRLVHGGGELLWVAFIPIAVSYLLGVPIGLLAGYVGGWIDVAAAFMVNVLFSIPGIVVVLAVAAATDNSLTAMTLVMGVAGSGAMIRLVRASTVAARDLLYVDAARVAGLSRRRILLRHILPNVAAPLVVQAFLAYGGIFLFLTSLSFLSLGFDPQQPSWGQITYEASQNISQHPWGMVPIGAAIILTILSINTLGSAALRFMPSQASAVRPRRRPHRPAQPGQPGQPATETRTTLRPVDPEALLRVEGLCVSIPGVNDDQPLVREVSLAVRRGETLAVVGESGSGKTLTALSVVGLLPTEAHLSGGRVVFDDTVTSDLPERRFRRLRGRRIGYVPQEPTRALDPCYTVRSQIVEALHAHGRISRRAARARAAELLGMVGIARVEDVLRSFPHQLSGGMAQRVAIAIAISGDPDLVVADEPTTALDVTVQAEILDLLRHLQDLLGMALVLITHDMGVVADMGDTVAVMHHGAVVECGPVRQVLGAPADAYTRELLAAAATHPRRSEPPKEVGNGAS